MNKPLCFVLMPFGKKPDGAGLVIDFDAVYRDLIAPAIRDAGLEPLRADEEATGGIIHKPMFERLILCEYAVADLTTANANVFYELGVRHAIKPCTTVLIFSEKSRLPFDVGMLRASPYPLNTAGAPENPDSTRKALADRLRNAKECRSKDSPIFQLIEGFPDIQRLKTDVFRERVDYAAKTKQRLAEARKKGVAELLDIERNLGNIPDQESGVVIDLFLSYRAVKAWPEMVALVDKMAPPLRQSVMVQEQLALALNRAGQSERAEQILKEVIEHCGPSSETYGLLGRVYKDHWERAFKHGDEFLARGLLDKAIAAYLRGFEADWRDAYPGINAATLMTLREPPDARREELLPVIRYAVERRIASRKPDYWDYATRLELAVLAKDQPAAESALADALAIVRETWEPETTARNLRLIREAREKRKTAEEWMAKIENALLNYIRK
jgi:tetratricopeptide (TPR) repeat protein